MTDLPHDPLHFIVQPGPGAIVPALLEAHRENIRIRAYRIKKLPRSVTCVHSCFAFKERACAALQLRRQNRGTTCAQVAGLLAFRD